MASEHSKWELLDSDLRKVVGLLLKDNDVLRERAAAVSFHRRTLLAELKHMNVEQWSSEELKEELLKRLNSH